MKTNMTHTILLAVSKEATKRGYFTQIMWNDGEWSLYIQRRGDDLRINRDTNISVIEDWMAPIDDLIEAGGEES